jgi:uncharacterized membrane protein YdjX (TVP38/TMEM64 family)
MFKSPASRFIGVAAGVLLIGVMLWSGVWLVTDTPLPGRLSAISPESIKELMLSWEEWGVVVSLLLMVLHSFVPFPAEFLAIANGMCYGPFWGTVITWSGAMLGASLAFALSRRFGRPFVERMLTRRLCNRVDDWTARYGADGIFLSRFVPIIAFNLINYAAGLTRISWWTFLWTTALGILPMTTLMVVLGAGMQDLSIYGWLAIAAAGLAAWLAVRRLALRPGAFAARPVDQENQRP